MLPRRDQIEWNPLSDNAENAYSGSSVVGFAGVRKDGSSFWKITAVFLNSTDDQGADEETASIEASKHALEEAWRGWLDAFDLSPRSSRIRIAR